MSKLTVKSNSYVTIQSFMVNDLHLSGNELIVYAVICGFSQDGRSWFTGSRSYLAAWCQTTERSISNILNRLLKKGFVEKRSRTEHGCTFNDYRATEFSMGLKNFPSADEKISSGTDEKISPHTLVEDITSTEDSIPYAEIIGYLNEQTGRNFDPNADANRKLIAARWRERPCTVEDFKRVIDNKVSRWLGDEKMEEYLRPSTLFAKSHFDEYLNSAPKKKNAKQADFTDILDGWDVEYRGGDHVA